MSKDNIAGAWVLTREHNEYDQHGAYFCGVWATKPTVEQLAEFFGHTNTTSVAGNVMEALAFLLHVQNGGGRRGIENTWYNLTFRAFGERVGE